jgi:thioredoxin-like negative regulator of GroEL
MPKLKVVEIKDIKSWESSVEKSSNPVLVMFYSPNCPHCHLMEPHFQFYAQEFKGKITFVKVNIKNNLNIAAKFGVLGTPTFTLFCKGRALQNYVGEMYPSLIKKMVEDGLQNSLECLDKATWIYPDMTGYT